MLAIERYEKIVKYVNKRKIISTKELSQFLNVTETTIRRDCEELEKKGLLLRVHGGIKSVETESILTKDKEVSMKQKQDINKEEKNKIAQYATSLLKDGDCIFLDGGTSIHSMVNYIDDLKIKVVTHSTLVSNAYNQNEHSELYLIGGKYIADYQMSVGPMTLSQVSTFNFDYSFIGCAGLDVESGNIYTAETETLAVKKAAMAKSKKKILLIDSSKVGIKGFCTLGNVSDFDHVIINKVDGLDVREKIQNCTEV